MALEVYPFGILLLVSWFTFLLISSLSFSFSSFFPFWLLIVKWMSALKVYLEVAVSMYKEGGDFSCQKQITRENRHFRLLLFISFSSWAIEISARFDLSRINLTRNQHLGSPENRQPADTLCSSERQKREMTYIISKVGGLRYFLLVWVAGFLLEADQNNLTWYPNYSLTSHQYTPTPALSQTSHEPSTFLERDEGWAGSGFADEILANSQNFLLHLTPLRVFENLQSTYWQTIRPSLQSLEMKVTASNESDKQRVVRKGKALSSCSSGLKRSCILPWKIRKYRRLSCFAHLYAVLYRIISMDLTRWWLSLACSPHHFFVIDLLLRCFLPLPFLDPSLFLSLPGCYHLFPVLSFVIVSIVRFSYC